MQYLNTWLGNSPDGSSAGSFNAFRFRMMVALQVHLFMSYLDSTCQLSVMFKGHLMVQILVRRHCWLRFVTRLLSFCFQISHDGSSEGSFNAFRFHMMVALQVYLFLSQLDSTCQLTVMFKGHLMVQILVRHCWLRFVTRLLSLLSFFSYIPELVFL